MIRRVVGGSMSPSLAPGRIIIASNIYKHPKAGQVFVFYQGGKEKIKRIERVSGKRIFFIGDNLKYSSDSRQFGWIKTSQVLGKVIWPRVNN